LSTLRLQIKIKALRGDNFGGPGKLSVDGERNIIFSNDGSE
jgi:hypothetical protein